MNIYKYANSKDIDKTYNYKILVYPNITYMRDLEKDSYVVVLANVIREINKVRDDIHWTILSPIKSAKDEIKSLQFENTTQLQIEFPSYPNAMRTHFDYMNFMKALDWKNNEYDIVYSHLPEHTNLLTNAIYNNTNMRPKFIGYCHWFEVKENTSYSKNLFIENISGILEMHECGVNSEWLKKLVIKNCKELFSDKVIQKLEKIIQPHYLGIDEISTGHKYKPKTILFNHRDNEYTGWSWFIKRMDELWEKRQDFKVYTTLADFPKITKKDKSGKEMKDGNGNKIWEIDLMLPNGLCYPEMVGDKYPLLYEANNVSSFKDTIENMLDNPKCRKEANKYLEPNLNGFKWNERVLKWFSNWKCLDELEIIGDKSEAYPKIVNFIKNKGFVTKRDITNHFNWGVRISLTAYRNRLRKEKDIRFTKTGYEYIGA